MKKIAVLLVSLLVAGGSFAATASEDVKISVWPSPTASNASTTNMIESYSGGQRLRTVASLAAGATVTIGSITTLGNLEPATVFGSTTFTLGVTAVTATVWLPGSGTTALKAIYISGVQSATSCIYASVSSLADLAAERNIVRCLGTAVREIDVVLSSATGTTVWVESSDDVAKVYIEYLR